MTSKEQRNELKSRIHEAAEILQGTSVSHLHFLHSDGTCKISINLGNGSKDRYVLFGKGFATALRTHIAAQRCGRLLLRRFG